MCVCRQASGSLQCWRSQLWHAARKVRLSWMAAPRIDQSAYHKVSGTQSNPCTAAGEPRAPSRKVGCRQSHGCHSRPACPARADLQPGIPCRPYKRCAFWAQITPRCNDGIKNGFEVSVTAPLCTLPHTWAFASAQCGSGSTRRQQAPAKQRASSLPVGAADRRRLRWVLPDVLRRRALQGKRKQAPGRAQAAQSTRQRLVLFRASKPS